jgi:hypothetical protein
MINETGNEADFSLYAASTMTSKQYYTIQTTAVAVNGLATAKLCTAGTTNGSNRVFGVLQNTPKLGESAKVRLWGITKAATVSAVSFGDMLTGSTSGAVATATTDNYTIGQALSASASTSGELITMILFNGGWNLNSAA